MYIVAGILALMVLFPPYIVENRGAVVYSGYSPLFAAREKQVKIVGLSGRQISVTKSAEINVGTLATQVIAVYVIGGLAYFAVKE